MPKQIEIIGRAGPSAGPRDEEHGALQHELIGEAGLPQAVEHALQGALRQDKPEALPTLMTEVEEALANGSREIRDGLPGHTLASM